MAIFQSMPEAEDEIKTWLADMAGETKESFDSQPADRLLDIVEELFSKKDIKDFFTRALGLISKPSKET